MNSSDGRRSVYFDEIIDTHSVSRFQVSVISLCAIIALLDGFDTQAIAFVAPSIAGEWGLERAVFGPIFSAALIGLAIGAVTLGTLADRVGRKRIIILSTLAFGIFSLLTAFAETLTQIGILRFLTGLGLGGAIPNIIALTSEYSPKHLRVRFVALMASGFPLGAFIGGLLSANIIETFGWQSVFIVGGSVPLLLIPVLVLKLPESIPFLLRSRSAEDRSRVHKYIAKIRPDVDTDNTDILLKEEDSRKSSIRELFRRTRILGTLMLWVVFFTNLLMFYFLVSWLPTIISATGVSISMSIVTASILNAGTVIGGFILGYLIDKKGPIKVLALNYIGAAVFTALIGMSGDSFIILLIFSFLAGFCVGGGQLAAVGFAASFYSAEIRSTGVGWAFGIGRCGAITAPLIGGLLLGLNLTIENLFLICGIPGLIAAFAVYLVGLTYKHPA